MKNDMPTTVLPGSTDIARTVLSVLLIIVLIGVSLWVLRPFLLAAIWGTMIVVATWPLMLKVQAGLRKRAFAVAVMTVAMLMVFVVPMFLAIRAFVINLDTITVWLRALPGLAIPPPPYWVARIPLAGEKIAQEWAQVAAAGTSQLFTHLRPFVDDAARWAGVAFGSIGLLTIQFLLTAVIAAIVYAQGETARRGLVRFGRRLAGDRGEAVVLLAGQSIRAVALGVVVTALVQTVLAGLGLAIAGIPFAPLLTAVVLILCIAQVGPLLVLIPAVVWLFWKDATFAGVALLVWTIIVGMLDNILRPLLIRRGADLPLLLIFAGVIGGLLAFGIIGLFVGPVALAVAYTLLKDWVADQDPT
jgi:predicted PurR-regulated permease PerM